MNHVWMNIGKAAGFDERFLCRLKLDSPNCPVFYSLIKTHKLSPIDDTRSMTAEKFKIRPIVSCVGGPTDRISWFLNKIVSQLLCKVPSHLSNTNQFLERLRNTRVEEGCVTESFDVTSLYTNVQNDHALQALSEMLNTYGEAIQTYGLSKQRIMVLIKECLSCNIFRWSGNYYMQLRGLAMGQRLAPVLAICFMSKIEEPVLTRNPLMYCRYIDDCCIITSTQSEMDECFRILNEQSEYIRFTREQPSEGWLPYLNAQFRISGCTTFVKWYRKSSSKNILINARSAHPSAVKRSVLHNMFRTAEQICTGDEERTQSRQIALDIARLNGYDANHTRSRPHNTGGHIQRNNKIPLCLPFISDQVSAAVQRSIKRALLSDDIILVNIPGSNIKKKLVRNRLYDRYCRMEASCVVCPYGNIGDCAKVGIVYQLECLSCSATYIGETGRPLAVRIKEHLAGKRRSSGVTPLGRHRRDAHGGDDYEIKCTILAHEREIAARKILEAFWISSRNPALNNKNECLSVTNEFMPFMELCNL